MMGQMISSLMITIPSLLKTVQSTNTISIDLTRVEQLLRSIISLTANRDGDRVKTRTDISEKAIMIF